MATHPRDPGGPVLAQATPSQELNALLTHPLVLAFATLFAAWLASRIVHEQVRKMGLEIPSDDPEESAGFGWTALFSALTFWAVLSLGLLGIASHIGLPVVSKFLQSGFDLLLRGLLAGSILAASSVFATALGQPASTDTAPTPKDTARARRERTTILLAGGALAIGAATGLTAGTWIMIALVGIPAVLLLRNAEYRKKVAQAFSNLASGVRLREQFGQGETISHEERTVQVVGKIGLLSTWVREDGRRTLLGNEELLALGTAATDSADEADDAGASDQEQEPAGEE